MFDPRKVCYLLCAQYRIDLELFSLVCAASDALRFFTRVFMVLVVQFQLEPTCRHR